MPLVRIDLLQGTPAAHRATLGAVVDRAMGEELGVPLDDRFQLLHEHAPENFLHTATYLGVHYSQRLLIIQITLNLGRTVAQKKAFYARLARDLQRALDIDPQDVFVSLVEVARENWSFGNGVAQYAAAD